MGVAEINSSSLQARGESSTTNHPTLPNNVFHAGLLAKEINIFDIPQSRALPIADPYSPRSTWTLNKALNAPYLHSADLAPLAPTLGVYMRLI